MSIPLDRLYHFLEDSVDHDMIIYRWLPHGSRNLEHCKPLRDYGDQSYLNPVVLCHDQEPLNFSDITDRLQHWMQIKDIRTGPTDWHLLYRFPWNTHSRYVLLHSEQNSIDVSKFEQYHAVPVYYWSHALIARDWFRYAQHDPVLTQSCSDSRDFLIYQRAWSGGREYRLKFSELLLDAGLEKHCLTSFNAVDDVHYRDHAFANPKLQIARSDLEHRLPPNRHVSSASADYCNRDYAQCQLEVVLETLCDDQRLHLTEKILRPIACGKPFLLVSTPGALAYLRGYGFRTFGDIIDESYDHETDVLKRLELILGEMQRLRQHPQRQRIYQELQQRARFNRHWFFSEQFHNMVVDEYKRNMHQALIAVSQSLDGRFLEERWQYTHQRDQRSDIYKLCRQQLDQKSTDVESLDPSQSSPGGLSR